MYAGHVRREMNRYMRTRPQPRVTVRQYDSNQRAFKPAEQKPKTVDLLPLVLALVAVALGAVVLSLPAPPSLQIPEVEAQH